MVDSIALKGKLGIYLIEVLELVLDEVDVAEVIDEVEL